MLATRMWSLVTERMPVPARAQLATFPTQNKVLAYDMNRPAGTACYHKPRGSWTSKEMYAIDSHGDKIAPGITDQDVYAKFEVTEPLLLSPFIFGSVHGEQGFYWIQAMNFQMVMNGGNANRAWRSGTRRVMDIRKTATVVAHENSQLLFQFITPHASDTLDPSNVVPYYEMPVYKTTGFQDLPGRSSRGQAVDDGSFSRSRIKDTILIEHPTNLHSRQDRRMRAREHWEPHVRRDRQLRHNQDHVD